jgi:glycosyltransferase involved in cell wall biosynthesis
VLNGENFLAGAIESCLTQDYSNFEVIIGINPSIDRTLEVAMRYAQDARVRVINFDSSVNMPANFNRSAKYARGTYLKFLCHDDILSGNALSLLREGFKEHTGIVLTLGYEQFIGSDRDIRGSASFGALSRLSGVRNFTRLIRRGNWIGGPSSVMLRSYDFLTRSFDEELKCSFDYAYWLYLSDKGAVAIVPEIVISSRVHPGQATNYCQISGFAVENQKILQRYLFRRERFFFFRRVLIVLRIILTLSKRMSTN